MIKRILYIFLLIFPISGLNAQIKSHTGLKSDLNYFLELQLQLGSDNFVQDYFKMVDPIFTQTNKLDWKQHQVIESIQMDSSINYSADGNIGPNGQNEKILYYYDEGKFLTEQLFQKWDSDEANWENSIKWSFEFMENGLLSNQINYLWQSNTQTWEIRRQLDLIYDQNNRLIEEIVHVYDIAVNELLSKSRITYEYEGAGEEVIRLFNYDFDFYENDWVNLFQYEYSYDIENNITEEMGYWWDPETTSWLYDNRVLYSYDDDNNRITSVFSLYNQNTGEWENASKLDREYDDLSYLEQSISYYWDKNLPDWVKYRRYLFSFELPYNLNSYAYEAWSESQEIWRSIFRIDQSFDYAYSYDDIAQPQSDNSNKITQKEIYFANEMNELELDASIQYFYSPFVTSTSQIADDNSLILYPNPNQGVLHFATNSKQESMLFELFNTDGKKIISQILGPQADKVNLSSIKSSGTYYYFIKNKFFQQSGSLIIHH